MRDSSIKDESHAPMSEEEFEEVVRMKGGRIVYNSRKDRFVVLNPPPGLVRKVRESFMMATDF